MAGRGYSHPAYAASLAQFGAPRQLRRCGGSVLERSVGGTPAHDLIGPYPLFGCADWSALADDVEELDGSAVSLVLVLDPLAGVDEAQLRRAFPDRLRPYKRHYVCDLQRPLELPRNHRRNIRRGASLLEVEVCPDPLRHLDDWTRLYAGLAARHGLTGMRAFSRESFRRQLAVPGLVALRAVRAERTVGMRLLYEDAPCAYDHLAAQDREGYELRAAYALVAAAVEHLRERAVRWLDLGGVPGTDTSSDGLARFKRGWADGVRIARLCGRILDRPAYARLAGARAGGAGWFPAYRAGERDLGAAGSPAARGRRA